MPNTQILYDTTTGRILSGNLSTITPVPAGHAVIVKDIDDLTELFEKKIDPLTLNLVNKDFLEFTPDEDLKISTVVNVVIQKKDGTTKESKTDVTDVDAFTVSTRNSDNTFTEPGLLAFFNILSGSLAEGAAQVKLASPAGPDSEVVVFHSEELTPIFRKTTYVI